MKIIKKIQPLILCIAAFGATIQPEIFSYDDNIDYAAQQDPSEIAVTHAFNQLQQIDTSIMQLALLITKGSIRNLKDPKGTINILRDIRTLIGSISKDQMAIIGMKNTDLNEQLTAALTNICDELILYLKKGLKNKLKGLKPFDVAVLTKRSLPKKPTRYGIRKNLQKIDSNIKTLKDAIDNVGLTWYNKLARTTDNWVVTPATRWHVPTVAFYGGIASLVTAYTIWQYGDQLMKNPNEIPSFLSFIKTTGERPGPGPLKFNIFNIQNLQNWFGHALPSGNHALNPTEAQKASMEAPYPYAVVELAIRETLLGINPLTAMACGYAATSFYQTQWPNISQVLTQKRDDVWNFLRGGQFLEQSSKMSFLDPVYTFDDMIGLDEVKNEFKTIIQYLENPELLANMHASPEKGWLLTGEKRTGKSFSFECLCGEIKRMQALRGQTNKFSFLNIDASLIHERGIKEILAFAQYHAPMILFIDEIDLLNLNRVGDTKLLNEFLTGLQNSMNQDPSKIVIIIAATNKPQTLDPALRANGRFGKEIRFEYPAKKYRIECITRELTNMALDIKQFDVERLAEKTDQKSIEDLRAIIRSAMTRAWMYSQQLTQQLLEESIDTEIHHIIMNDRKDLPENEMRILASHFAGRAFVTLSLPMNAKLDKVTIHARMTDLAEEAQWADLYKDKHEKDKEKKIEHGHLTIRLTNDSIHVKNEQEILNEAKSRIAGFIAEEILLGSCGFTCHPREHERAYRILEQLVFEGLNPSLVAKAVGEELKQKAFNLLKQCKAEVKQLLTDHQEALKAIADELMAKHILTDKEVQAIINKIETAKTDILPAAIATEDVATEPAEVADTTENVMNTDDATDISEATDTDNIIENNKIFSMKLPDELTSEEIAE